MTRGVSELLSCSLRSKHTRNSESEDEQRRRRADGEEERVWGKKSIEGLSPHACTVLFCLLLISSMRDPALFKDLRPFPPKQVRWNPPGGGGDSHMKQTGMLVGNFEFNP